MTEPVERIPLEQHTPATLAALEHERDQHAAAIRHLILRIKQTAYVWSQTLPDMIPTAEVVKALGLLAPMPLPEGLRNDLWQQIVGAYYVRFENDGHPEDSKAAADEAMAIVQPELDRLHAALDRVTALHSPVQHMGQTWCGECSVRRSTGPKTEEWVAYIPHPCLTIDALNGKES